MNEKREKELREWSAFPENSEWRELFEVIDRLRSERDEARAEIERARVKALREAADAWRDSSYVYKGRNDHAQNWMRRRADAIERDVARALDREQPEPEEND